MQTKRCVELVIAPSGDAFMMWDARGTNYIAENEDALGRWALEVVRDESTPQVAFESPSPGVWTKAVGRLLEAAQRIGPQTVDPAELVAVHVVVQYTSEPLTLAIWPAKGAPVVALSSTRFGAELATIARDASQPRVRPGPPPDPGAEIIDKASAIAADYIRAGTSSPGA